MRGVLLGLAVGLFAWDRALLDDERAARETANRIGRLIPREAREGLEVGGLTLQSGAGAAHAYALGDDGNWRCTSLHDALCEKDRIDQLLRELLEAEGVVQAADRPREREFGFGQDATWTLGVHARGAAAPAFTVEIGGAMPDPARCFARLAPRPQVWEIDVDLRKYFDLPPGYTLPPLVDPRVVPRAWLTASKRLDRIAVRGPGVDYALQVRERQVSEDDLKRGVRPYQWFLIEKDRETACPDLVAAQYTSYLFQVPFTTVADAAQVPQRGGTMEPAATVSFIPEEGEPLEIRVGAPAGNGFGYLFCTFSGSLIEVRAELVNLMFPEPATLLADTQQTPWDRYLQR
jgi:hypothetical protein